MQMLLFDTLSIDLCSFTTVANQTVPGGRAGARKLRASVMLKTEHYSLELKTNTGSNKACSTNANSVLLVQGQVCGGSSAIALRASTTPTLKLKNNTNGKKAWNCKGTILGWLF